MNDENETKTEAPAVERHPMQTDEILEWISTVCLFAAWVWRKGYERGKAA
jgi:hypothetical protein